MNLGEKIRAARKELKMTQAELAGQDLSKAMISHIETGRAQPSIRVLSIIAERLGKPLSYFLGDVDGSEELNNILCTTQALIDAGCLPDAIARAQAGLKLACESGELRNTFGLLMSLGKALYKSRRFMDAYDQFEEAYEASLHVGKASEIVE
ncbi:helix-turn-helix domain-containing protein, partial [Alicyclobacillus shizuokensis]|uniref:helix-turn-helix domain-containing protein n=1 Tax=Alicyclobacillus shizuokensis TaxID=392014 RepID=UPI000B2743AA